MPTHFRQRWSMFIVNRRMYFFFLTLRKTNREKFRETYTNNTYNGFKNNCELAATSLYAITKPVEELGYTSKQKQQSPLPLTDSKGKDTANIHYDVPANKRPKGIGASPMPGYAVPKKVL